MPTQFVKTKFSPAIAGFFMQFNIKNIAFILVCLLSKALLASDYYFDSLEVTIQKTPLKEKVEKIHAIPFDKMNSNTLSAIRLYKKALEISQQINDENLVGISYEKLSLAYYYKGDYDLSISSALSAIKYFEKQNNKEKIGSIYSVLGYQMKRRNLPKAFYYMQKGIQFLEQTNDQKALSAAYNNYGVLHEMDSDIDSALFFYNKGLEIVVDIKDTIGIPYSLNNIAGAYVIKGEYEKALPFYHKAFEMRSDRNDLNGLAENNSYYGDFYYKQNRFSEAIPFYQKALEIGKEINYTYLLNVISEQLAYCYTEIKDFQKALFYKQQAESYKDSLLNESTNKTIHDLEIQFETEKKEKQIANQKAELSKQQLKLKQRNYILTAIAGLILFFLVISVLVYRRQKFKQQQLLEENKLKEEIAKIQLKNKLQEERLRISRDLHDNIGAQFTFIISSIDNIQYYIKDSNEQLKTKLEELNKFSRIAITELRNTIKSLNNKDTHEKTN